MRVICRVGFALIAMVNTQSSFAAGPTEGQCQKTAKNTPASSYCDQLVILFSDADANTKQLAAAKLGIFWTIDGKLPAAFQYSMFKAFLEQLTASRLDKQTGTTGTANGSTDLVSLPGTTDFVSAAVNVGALTQSTSGTTTTVTGNAGQLISAFKPSTYDYSLNKLPGASDFAVSLSFSVNPTTPTSVTTNGSATSTNAVPTTASVNTSTAQFSGVGLRYARFNRFDPLSAQFQQAFTTSMSDQAETLRADDKTLDVAMDALQEDFSAVEDDTEAAKLATTLLSAPNLLAAIKAFNSYFDGVQNKVDVKGSLFETHLDAFAQAMQAKLNLYRTVFETAKGPPAFTFEYNYSRPQNQPDTHNARVIGAVQGSAGMLTLNAAATFYGALPANALYGHFRDAQVAMQGDIPLSRRSSMFVASFAGYGQYQRSPSILNVSASDIPSGLDLVAGAPAFISGTQGWLGVFQAKFTITGAHGVKVVPISYKWSNHTELFAQSSSTVQFGLSYDLASLVQLTGSK